MNLRNRRPDLDNLVLSEDNLHQELTTLELSNELLMAQTLYPLKKSLDFEGPCHMEAPANIDLASKSFTIEFWARQNQITGEYLYARDFELIGIKNGLHIDFGSQGPNTFLFNAGSYTWANNAVDDRWHHWACRFNYDAPENKKGILNIYRDGVRVGEEERGNSTTAIGPVVIASPGKSGLGAQMCEIRIWNTLRTPEQINELCGSFLAGTQQALELVRGVWLESSPCVPTHGG